VIILGSRRWQLLALLACLALVVLLGVADYLTGDYSLVIFYLIPITCASWLTSWKGGAATAVACGAGRLISDFALHGASLNSPLHYWNFTVEVLFFGIVVALVAALQRALRRPN
jgi:hypothetical protein